MKKEQLIRNRIKQLRVEPRDEVWSALEKRLDTKNRRFSLHPALSIAIAACFIVLFGVFVLFEQQQTLSVNQLAELPTISEARFTSVQEVYLEYDWEAIQEGSASRKLVAGL